MIRRWLVLTYYLYALSHFYFTPTASKTVKKAACTCPSEVQAAFSICKSTVFPVFQRGELRLHGRVFAHQSFHRQIFRLVVRQP